MHNNAKSITNCLLLTILAYIIIGCSGTPTATRVLSCEIDQPPYIGIVKKTPYPEYIEVTENTGQVCFYINLENKLKAQVYSSGCYSSTCSQVFERTGEMKINEENKILRFNIRVAIQPINNITRPGWDCTCTADCGGAGLIEYDLNEIYPGTYSIILGETKIGEVIIPLKQSDICFDSEKALPQPAYP